MVPLLCLTCITSLTLQIPTFQNNPSSCPSTTLVSTYPLPTSHTRDTQQQVANTRNRNTRFFTNTSNSKTRERIIAPQKYLHRASRPTIVLSAQQFPRAYKHPHKHPLNLYSLLNYNFPTSRPLSTTFALIYLVHPSHFPQPLLTLPSLLPRTSWSLPALATPSTLATTSKTSTQLLLPSTTSLLQHHSFLSFLILTHNNPLMDLFNQHNTAPFSAYASSPFTSKPSLLDVFKKVPDTCVLRNNGQIGSDMQSFQPSPNNLNGINANGADLNGADLNGATLNGQVQSGNTIANATSQQFCTPTRARIPTSLNSMQVNDSAASHTGNNNYKQSNEQRIEKGNEQNNGWNNRTAFTSQLPQAH